MAAATKPKTANTNNLPVRLILCLDGTGDTAKGSFNAKDGKTAGSKDSIRTIYDLTKEGPVTDANGRQVFQYVAYFEGVGTVGASDNATMMTRATALFDAATGNGYLDILQNAYRVCCDELQTGEINQNEIFMFGFSRGAFISRALASFLQHVGLIKSEALGTGGGKNIFRRKFYEQVSHYMNITGKSLRNLWRRRKSKSNQAEPLLEFAIPSPPVRLLGAFDTVKTVIPLPLHNLFNHGIPNVDFKMDAPEIVQHFRHALALNDERPLFYPDLWKSPANSKDSSYQEAWFFGYHHDVGGGDEVQGLALWPLQWILKAAMKYGLALDSTISPYDILFLGTDNDMGTPYGVTLEMFDMIRYHKTIKTWGLRLNKPFSLMAPLPREYFEYLTGPAKQKLINKPRVFVHPSAYLVFDVSSSFRIEVYQWKFFRSFLRDRAITLPHNVIPWWEKQTENNILAESGSNILNLLTIGHGEVGKEEVLRRLFGRPTKVHNGILSHTVFPGNTHVQIYQFDFTTDKFETLEDFLGQLKAGKLENIDKIHAVWYFVDSTKELDEADRRLSTLDFLSIPILVIFLNEEKLKTQILRRLPPTMLKDVIASRKYGEAVDGIQRRLDRLHVKKYVRSKDPLNIPSELLIETSHHLEDEHTHLALIKAQCIDVRPKIAVCIEESIRAFAIWHRYKTKGEKTEFKRGEHTTNELTFMLMKPIMEIFNMGFTGDMEFIEDLIGAPWNRLKRHKLGLCDKGLPGSLILLCMLDTAIVMTYALLDRNFKCKCRPGIFKANALPFSAAEIEQACAWYTGTFENRQGELRRMITELLEPDGTLRDNSIVNFQMKVIEAVELISDKAETANQLSFIGLAITSKYGRKILLAFISAISTFVCFYTIFKAARVLSILLYLWKPIWTIIWYTFEIPAFSLNWVRNLLFSWLPQYQFISLLLLGVVVSIAKSDFKI